MRVSMPSHEPVVHHYPPGRSPIVTVPGDLILFKRKGIYSKLIGFGQKLRRGYKGYAYWTHVGCVASYRGGLIEALGKGIVVGDLSKYEDVDYYYVDIKADEHDRNQMVKFLQASLGRPYGYLDILSLTMTLVVGNRLSFGDPGTLVCSTLAAQMLCRGDFIFPTDPGQMMPADLAKLFKVGETKPSISPIPPPVTVPGPSGVPRVWCGGQYVIREFGVKQR